MGSSPGQRDGSPYTSAPNVGPVEKKRRRKLLYPHPKLSLGLVPYRPFILTFQTCGVHVCLLVYEHNVAVATILMCVSPYL